MANPYGAGLAELCGIVLVLAVVLAGGGFSCGAVGLASISNSKWITAEVRAPDHTLQRVLHVSPFKLCVSENGTEACQTYSDAGLCALSTAGRGCMGDSHMGVAKSVTWALVVLAFVDGGMVFCALIAGACNASVFMACFGCVMFCLWIVGAVMGIVATAYTVDLLETIQGLTFCDGACSNKDTAVELGQGFVLQVVSWAIRFGIQVPVALCAGCYFYNIFAKK